MHSIHLFHHQFYQNCPYLILFVYYIYIELQFDVYVIYTLLSSSMFHSSINVLYTFRVQSSFSNHSHRRGRPFLSCCRAAWTRQLVVGSECWSSCPWKRMGYKIGNIREYHWDLQNDIRWKMKFESVWNLGWFLLACISVFSKKTLCIFKGYSMGKNCFFTIGETPGFSEKWQPRRGGYPSDHLIQMAAWQWSSGQGMGL